MEGKLQLLEIDINDLAVDNRGVIYSFVPKDPIVEFCYQYTNKGATRGFHHHEEFDEYVMLVDGEWIYTEYLYDRGTRKIVMGTGQTIYIPRLTPHSFVAISDCKSVSFLTKKWNDCAKPITKQHE